MTAAADTVSILFFAAAADLVGADRLQLSLAGPQTLAELQQTLFRQYPPLAAQAKFLMWAVNEQYAAAQTKLQAGDTIACIPPVSGG